MQKRADKFNLSGKILLGSGKFGGIVNDESCFYFMDLYRELGGCVVDTGHCYGMFYPGVYRQPLSERVIGRYLKSRGRDSLLVCTKGGYFDLDDKHFRLKEADLRFDIEESLRELQTDVIDIYYLHRDDPSLPVDEIMVTANRFSQEGKIRALGVSNWAPDRIRDANRFARENNCIPIEYVQNLWNLGAYDKWPMNDPTMRITSSEDKKEFSLQKELQLIAYSAQAYGFYSKADPKDPETTCRLLAEKYPFFNPEASLARADRVWQLSQKYNVPVSAIVLSYILSDPLAPAAIIGCTKEEQLREAMASASLRLTAEEIAYLDEPQPVFCE